jgi:hypothetical protein
MDYLTYLDYSLLEAKGKDVESQLEERKQEIKQLKQRDKTNDEAIAKMQEQLTKLQDEVSLQYRMSLGWATETSHWSERLVEEMKKVEDISTMRDLKKWKEMRKEYLKKAEEEKSKSIESYLKKKK